MLIDFMVAYPGWRDEVQCGGQSQPPRTCFISRPSLPMDQSSIHLHTLQVEKAKGRAVVSVNCDPCISTLVLLLCLMGNLRVSSSWTLLSQEINMTIVFWHRRFAVWGVTCSVVIQFEWGFKGILYEQNIMYWAICATQAWYCIYIGVSRDEKQMGCFKDKREESMTKLIMMGSQTPRDQIHISLSLSALLSFAFFFFWLVLRCLLI